MRVLILYSSKHGQTQRIAEHIADITRSDGAETFLFQVGSEPRDIAPHIADVVVLAGSVYFGRYPKALEHFVIGQRANLAKTRTVFVSVSGSARSEEGRALTREYVNAFIAKTGWSPDSVELFAGGEPYTRYNFVTRFIMKRLARKQGRLVDTKCDYDFTDWNAVSRFARGLTGKDVLIREPELAML